MSMMDHTQWPHSASFAAPSTAMEDSASDGSSRNSLELYGDEYSSDNLIDTTNTTNTNHSNLDHAFGTNPGESNLFLQSFLTEMSSTSTGTGSPSPSGFYHSSSTGASSPSFSAYYNSSSPGSPSPFSSNPFAPSPFPHFGQNSGEAFPFQDCPGADGCDAFQLEISGGASSTSFQSVPPSSSSSSTSSPSVDLSAFPSSLPPAPQLAPSEMVEMSDVGQGYQADQSFGGEITSVEEVDQLIASLVQPYFNTQPFATNPPHRPLHSTEDQAPARKRPRSSLDDEQQVANTQFSMLPTTFHPHPNTHSHPHSHSQSQSSLSIACPPSQSQLQTQTQPQAFDMVGNPIHSHKRTPSSSSSSSSSSTPSPSSSTHSPSSSNGMMIQIKTASPSFGSLSPILTTPTGTHSPQMIAQGGQPRLAPAPGTGGPYLTAEEKEDAMLSSVGLNRQQLLHMTSREFDTYRKKLETTQELSEEQKLLLQYQRRTIKNREYAQTSRQKKRNLLTILESRVQVLESENSSLSSQNAQLQSKLIQLANSFRSFSAESMRSHRLLSDRLALLDPHFSPSSLSVPPSISTQRPSSLVQNNPTAPDRPRDRISLPGSNKRPGFNNNNISVLVIVLSIGVLFSSSFFPSLSSSPSSSLSPSGGSSRVIMSEDQADPGSVSFLHNLLWVFEWRTIEQPLNWLYEMFIPHSHKHLVLDDPLDSLQDDSAPAPLPSPSPSPSPKTVNGLSPLPQEAVEQPQDLPKDNNLDLLESTDPL